jgi:hypothetical protein
VSEFFLSEERGIEAVMHVPERQDYPRVGMPLLILDVDQED